MKTPLRILHLEDEADFSLFVKDLLHDEGVDAEWVLTQNRAQYTAAMAQGGFDVILADYHLPDFTGTEALKMAREQAPETPFLVVSGTIGESAAVESLRAGATDYVLKQWPDRLAPAVRRAVNDAVERRRVQQSLRETEQRFHDLFESSPDAIFVEDLDGTVLDVNPAGCLLHGETREAIIGRNVLSLVPEKRRAEVERDFRLFAEGKVQRVEGESISIHGKATAVEIRASRIAFDGKPALLLHVRDVSDRKHVESALHSSEMLFHSVWENSVDGMRLTDENGKVVAVNDAFCSLVGMHRAELQGQPFTVIYAPSENPDRILEKYRERFRDRVIERQIERALTLHNGQTVVLEDTNSFVELRGHAPLLLGLFRDVTAHKRLEEQLRQSQKMDAIGQLAGGVAHDFNNILTVIQGHASLLHMAPNFPESSRKSAQQVVQAAERAAGLTRQLLTFSRRQVMQPRCLDLNEVVSNMAGMLERILREDIQLELSYCPQPALVLADNGMMEQILLNLVVNARDAMPRGGQLDVKISRRESRAGLVAPGTRVGNFVCLTVTDTGSGIAPENLPRIFEPFFTTKEVGKGTGLGLATVYGIVNQHQGWIEVDSTVGKGTRFLVHIPFAGDKPEKKDDKTPETVARGGSETIMIVEDEPPVRELVEGLLEGYGYKVLAAESGAKAINLWRERNGEIDLLLTDLVMPDQMNGRELAEKLCAERPALKVIFTSGYSADVVGREFAQRRGLYYLQKPYHPRKLAVAVRECLDMGDMSPEI